MKLRYENAVAKGDKRMSVVNAIKKAKKELKESIFDKDMETMSDKEFEKKYQDTKMKKSFTSPAFINLDVHDLDAIIDALRDIEDSNILNIKLAETIDSMRDSLTGKNPSDNISLKARLIITK